MPNYKVVDAEQLDAAMTATADAIRAKGGTAEPIPWDELTGFSDAVGAIVAGSPEDVPAKDVNFLDYDGTILYSYTVEEAAALTELPPLPSHDGLICQGWNWSLAEIKSRGGLVDVGAMYITDDGTTRIYITLTEERRSPVFGCCPNGTVTVDWGDGTAPDVLTGTSITTEKWTPAHEYEAAGTYVISLTVDGEMGLCSGGGLKHPSLTSSVQNAVYRTAIKKVEIGSGITSIGSNAFEMCFSLECITVPFGVANIAWYGFYACYSLKHITLPKSMLEINMLVFSENSALSSISLPNSVMNLYVGAFGLCYSLERVIVPDGVSAFAGSTFSNSLSLKTIVLPSGLTAIGGQEFEKCQSLTSVTIPAGVNRIFAKTFSYCYAMRFYDFSRHTSVPKLDNTDAFTEIPADCEIRVPAALADEWKAATNWATYADYIVGV